MEHIADNFSIEILECTEWKERNRKNNFFELVYILDGHGQHIANHIPVPYQPQEVFLLPAAKCHSYHIEEKTTFLFIRFTTHYFAPGIIDYTQWMNRMNFILANHDYLPGELVTDPDDKVQLQRFLDIIQYEYKKNESCGPSIIRNTLASILALISRNIQRKIQSAQSYKDQRFTHLIEYINYNLLDAKKITVKHLAKEFHIPTTYFSEYFSRNADENFQDYVLRSKIRIAVSRAKYTDATFQGIALELGFTDSSHLNRMMKKYSGKTMRAIREEMG
ncbi:helix-turn-helix transcriptional regulator [Chitinophaga sp. LS1]|uniref:helix-turn-helix domain-containing protein n=1 Tax=Chitinophaga sp. LS1 TaxID=3051176 RepID=UPI002AABAD56|nr:helix-turn-helix transcriptional regulator [Chitinophaga sp. LS1]WPV70272.1 helix-turn-helix transcriptional regulator [Chitinophaga sp. LS1]